jgi:hypothetical protein
MTTTSEMLRTHPGTMTMDRQLLAECIDACIECAESCTACADACIGEPMVADLRTCIRLNLDCADICDATGRVLFRMVQGDGAMSRSLLQACAQACSSCAQECERHAEMMEHCRICAEACRRCEQACNTLLASVG